MQIYIRSLDTGKDIPHVATKHLCEMWLPFRFIISCIVCTTSTIKSGSKFEASSSKRQDSVRPQGQGGTFCLGEINRGLKETIPNYQLCSMMVKYIIP